MDAIDKKILTLLQKDASISLAVLAAQINLTTTPCWKRVQRLERDGYITKRVALASPEKLNLKVSVLVTVKTTGLSADQIKKFVSDVSGTAYVLDFFQLDDADTYSIRLVMPDRAAYDVFHKRLVDDLQIKDITTNFVSQSLKQTTAYPVSALTVRK
ncbi:Lrp/AsnC family transcriptional regulator [Microvirga sp. W0021]|uniref:Lrp/AsnC family transcriptional regulator n=1 Tax=Hohaiivirga grylli TaxID=3133970 RepID=A0ABV0BG84_9HYPH